MSLLTSVRALPTHTKTLLILSMVNHLGTGLVLPFLVIFITEGNGLSLQTATTTIAVVSTAAVGGTLLAGWLADRKGAYTAAAIHMIIQGCGIAGYALSSETWQFMAAAVVVGIGGGGSAAWNSLLAEATPQAQHSQVFSLNFTAANASVGIGGLIGAVVTATGGLLSFRLLYLANACASFVVAFILLVALRSYWRKRGSDGLGPALKFQHAEKASYRLVFQQPMFLVLLTLGGILFCATFVQLESGLPAFLTTETKVSASQLALLFAINTGCIVAAQFILHSILTAWKPVTSIVASAWLWTVSWGLVFATSLVETSASQFGLLVAAIAVFAVAETFHAAGMPTLVNKMAPPHARGRFNAAHGVSKSLAFIIGPLAAGFFVAAGAGRSFIGGLAVVCAVIGCAFLISRLRFVVPSSSSPASNIRSSQTTQPVDLAKPNYQATSRTGSTK